MSGHTRVVWRVAFSVILLPCSPLRAEDESHLRDPIFAENLKHWETAVYGARPRVQVETDVLRQGRALRISSREPSDTAVAQEVDLKAGRFYRFSGWVRTRGLDPQAAPVCGTFQVQHPGGRGTIAGGTNHGGDTDWTETPVYFQAPPGGQVRV